MKSQKTIRKGIVTSAATLAMLLALGTAHAGKPVGNNKGGASIGISNTCALADDTAGKPVLRVTTTIVNKSSKDATPYFVENGMIVIGEEKSRGKGKYTQVGDAVIKTASLGDPIVTDISLCKADGTGTTLSSDTVSLNATVSIDVINDNKAEYSNRCSDDSSTDGVDEGKVFVSPSDLDAICRLP